MLAKNEDWALSQPWFHSLDLGDGLVTPGRFSKNIPPNFTLYGALEFLSHMDLNGARCVDVGTMDGLVAFTMKKAGASTVLATDLARRQTFEFARQRLGLDIDYRVPVPIHELPDNLTEWKADVLAVPGVIYHLLDPLTAIAICRRSVRQGGYLIVETAYDVGEGSPRMVFNPADLSPGASEQPNVFWRPSKAALEAMCRLAGFDVVATIAVDNRLTVLAQAVRPSEIRGRTERTRGIHGCYGGYKNYCEPVDFDALENDTAEPSTVEYRGERGDRRIYPATHNVSSPLQPDWRPASVAGHLKRGGRSAWFHGIAKAASLRTAATSSVAKTGTRIKKFVMNAGKNS